MYVDAYLPIKAGTTIPLDWRYVTYSMLKQECRSDLTQRGWQLLPFFGRQRGDLLHFHREDGLHAFRVRLPIEDLGYLRKLEDRPITIARNLLIFGECVIREIEPKPVLHSDLVLISSDQESRGVRDIDFGLHVGKRLGAMLGRTTFGVEFGPRKPVHIKGSRLFGHEVTVKGLVGDESLQLQRKGIGEARSMGCGVFL